MIVSAYVCRYGCMRMRFGCMMVYAVEGELRVECESSDWRCRSFDVLRVLKGFKSFKELEAA